MSLNKPIIYNSYGKFNPLELSDSGIKEILIILKILQSDTICTEFVKKEITDLTKSLFNTYRKIILMNPCNQTK